jgi:hypothetical protein
MNEIDSLALDKKGLQADKALKSFIECGKCSY